MKRGALLFTALLFLFSIPTAELAAQEMRGRGHGFRKGSHRGQGRGPGMDRGMCFGDRDHMRENLNITDRQINLISSINEKFRGRLIVFRDRLHPKKNELRKLLLRDTLDLKSIKKLLKEIADIEVEIRMIRIVQRKEIEKVLTPSQREKMRRERRMHRGPGKHDR
jgi:Spy/CpxP family protein refolding chaperone